MHLWPLPHSDVFCTLIKCNHDDDDCENNNNNNINAYVCNLYSIRKTFEKPDTNEG